MQVDLAKFQAVFFEEADEHLANMEAALLQLENNPHDPELLNTVFRSAHTIKGGSSTFGIEDVASFTHVLENLLERLRNGELHATGTLVELLLQAVDALEHLIAAAKSGTSPAMELDSLLKQLHAANESTPNAAVVTPAPIASHQVRRFDVRFVPSRTIFQFGQDPLLLLRELSELGVIQSVQIDTSRLPSILELDPELCYLGWSFQLHTTEPESKIRDVFLFLDDDSVIDIQEVAAPQRDSQTESTAWGLFDDELSTTSVPQVDTTCVSAATKSLTGDTSQSVPANETKQSPPPATSTTVAASPLASSAAPSAESKPRPTSESESVRVDRARLDKLINQIGELVIGASIVEQEWSAHSSRESHALVQLGKIVRDLQEMSLSLRMVPIAGTFQKMSRVIRDLAKKLGKEISFETEGDETELDKTVVDQIGDPLLHMVRNAADHGIESPDDRVAAGKSKTGHVKLRAYHQGGNIFLELTDDGRGLDRQRIYQKAVERGIIQEGTVLSEQDILNLIFQPGFSTAATITDVSGRGVGMDVVKRNIEALQGSVTIKSELGKGSIFTVRLPLTLAILDGLLIRLGNEVFVLPLLSVVESFRPSRENIRTVAVRGEVVSLRGEVLPLVRLHRRLNLATQLEDPTHGLIVIVEEQSGKYGLLVDELLGQQQVVIKNLEANFRKVPGVAGATILGDGRVALILDLSGLGQSN